MMFHNNLNLIFLLVMSLMKQNQFDAQDVIYFKLILIDE